MACYSWLWFDDPLLALPSLQGGLVVNAYYTFFGLCFPDCWLDGTVGWIVQEFTLVNTLSLLNTLLALAAIMTLAVLPSLLSGRLDPTDICLCCFTFSVEESSVVWWW